MDRALVFVSIEKIYQTLETVSSAIQSGTTTFIENTPPRVVFSTLFSVFGYPDKTLFLVFDIFIYLFLDFALFLIY